MSDNIMNARDAIARARGVNRGLGALVDLLMGNEAGDVKSDVCPADVAELLWSVRRDLDVFLEEAHRNLEAVDD